jgi:RNA polymerase sigma-70 factor (ECF subfamily)
MTDIQIIDLFCERSESAIEETARHYGSYCTAIAMKILQNNQDVEECVNDTYLRMWESIPPARPTVLSSFIGRITRNLSLDRYKARKAQKRCGDESALLLSELEGCIPAAGNLENEVEDNELVRIIEDFLDSGRREDKIFFVRRYWHADSVAQIAKRYEVSNGKVKMSLMRTRKKMKAYLEERGISV